MSFDAQPIVFSEAILAWLMTAGGMMLLVLGVSFLSALSQGNSGLKMFSSEVGGVLSDLISLSPRRIWALAKLTFIEAYRRKALAVFVVFALLFMFAGWFMGGGDGDITNDQVKVYVSFVLRAISWLTLPMALVLSSFGIPEDIRIRSLHTVVTKPARRLEIVMGRVLGFTLIGTLVLSVMSVVGWIWIVRGIPAKAQEMLVCRVPVKGELTFVDRDGVPAEKGINTGDIVDFRSYIEGATKARAIWTFDGIDESVLDSEGNLNLENQFFAFRSYKGDMNHQLLYDFQFRNPEKKISFTTNPMEMGEFRGVRNKIARKLERPGDEKTYDLIKDFVTSKGTLTVEVSCIDREQYLGMARPDLFIRLPDRSFAAGYFKAVLGIELMMILVILISVCSSTFLKGPIAALLTFVLLILGGEDSHKFMDQLVTGRSKENTAVLEQQVKQLEGVYIEAMKMPDSDEKQAAVQAAKKKLQARRIKLETIKNGFKGGGFLESIYRIYTHMNDTTELPEGNPAMKIMVGVDNQLTGFLWLCKQIIPRLATFNNMSEYVANGFDVPWDSALLPCVLVTLGYLLPCILLGYFALRVRELESK